MIGHAVGVVDDREEDLGGLEEGSVDATVVAGVTVSLATKTNAPATRRSAWNTALAHQNARNVP